jgi:hypothetical protein
MILNIYMDGDKWCCIEEGTSLPEALAGFGDKISDAIQDYANQLKSVAQ